MVSNRIYELVKIRKIETVVHLMRVFHFGEGTNSAAINAAMNHVNGEIKNNSALERRKNMM